MNIQYECLMCLTKQIISVATNHTKDTNLQKKIIKRYFKDLSEISFNETAPYIVWKANKYINSVLKIDDPYKEIKENSNKLAYKICEEFNLYDLIKKSKSPIETVCRLSIAGNIIDFSYSHNIQEEEIKETIKKCLTDRLFGTDIDEFIDYVNKSNNILFLADNSGEIVFDTLLLEKLPKEKITYVVKGGPIVNDATIKDAKEINLEKLVRVIDNGSDAQGTILDLCSEKFKKEFAEADLIICKGQANYETLSHIRDKNIFYLFKAKCPPVAKDVGCNVGDLVIKLIK